MTVFYMWFMISCIMSFNTYHYVKSYQHFPRQFRIMILQNRTVLSCILPSICIEYRVDTTNKQQFRYQVLQYSNSLSSILYYSRIFYTTSNVYNISSAHSFIRMLTLKVPRWIQAFLSQVILKYPHISAVIIFRQILIWTFTYIPWQFSNMYPCFNDSTWRHRNSCHRIVDKSLNKHSTSKIITKIISVWLRDY